MSFNREEFIRKHDFVLRYNPEYEPIAGAIFQPDAHGQMRNKLLPVLPDKPFFAFPSEVSVLLGNMTWKDAWSFLKSAEMTGALGGSKEKPMLPKDAVEILRGERTPCPYVIRRFWERQGERCGVVRSAD